MAITLQIKDIADVITDPYQNQNAIQIFVELISNDIINANGTIIQSIEEADLFCKIKSLKKLGNQDRLKIV